MGDRNDFDHCSCVLYKDPSSAAYDETSSGSPLVVSFTVCKLCIILFIVQTSAVLCGGRYQGIRSSGPNKDWDLIMKPGATIETTLCRATPVPVPVCQDLVLPSVETRTWCQVVRDLELVLVLQLGLLRAPDPRQLKIELFSRTAYYTTSSSRAERGTTS